MEQRCHLSAIWLTWLGLPALALVVLWRLGWVAAVFVLAVGVVGQILYIRWFPRLSTSLGYGSVGDVAAPAQAPPTPGMRVTLYTANVCPFCPIIKSRLGELQRTLGFEMEEVDVTFHPEIIRAKKLRSVPVVEANGQFLVGNATSKDLAAFLGQATAAW